MHISYLKSASLSLSLSFNLLNEFYKSYTREKAVHFSDYPGTEEIMGSDNVKSREYCTSLHQSFRSGIPKVFFELVEHARARQLLLSL